MTAVTQCTHNPQHETLFLSPITVKQTLNKNPTRGRLHSLELTGGTSMDHPTFTDILHEYGWHHPYSSSSLSPSFEAWSSLGDACPPPDTISSSGCEHQVQPNLKSVLLSRDGSYLCLLSWTGQLLPGQCWCSRLSQPPGRVLVCTEGDSTAITKNYSLYLSPLPIDGSGFASVSVRYDLVHTHTHNKQTNPKFRQHSVV